MATAKSLCRSRGAAICAAVWLLVGCADLLGLKDRQLAPGAGGSPSAGSGAAAGTSLAGTDAGAPAAGGASGDTAGTGGAASGAVSGMGGDASSLAGAGIGGEAGTGEVPGKECAIATDCAAPVTPLDQCYQLGCDNGHCAALPKAATATCSSDDRSGLCNGAGGCEVCAPDTFLCQGDDLYRCAFSRANYELAGQCAAGLCDDSAGLCHGCRPLTAVCSADHKTRIACSADGQGQTQETRPGQLCTGAGNWVDCVVDADCPDVTLPACMTKACTSANMCGAKPTLLSSSCSGGTCDGAGNCLVCASGSYRCVGAALQLCSAARTGWDAAATCSSAALCSATAKQCLACAPNSASCSASNPHSGQQCSADGLSSTPVTDPNRFCTGQGVWVDCRTAADCPAPSNPCTQATCSNSTCGTTPKAATATCAGNGSCDGSGVCLGPAATSCQAISLTCQGVSCCQNRLVQGGSFPMGRGLQGSTDACPAGVTCTDSTERPEHTATVSDFYLDTFEVTVGRFRQFYINYDSIHPLADNAGASPHLAGSGWQAAWNSLLPATQNALLSSVQCNATTQTWPPTPNGTATENRAINCVTWYEAAAFCAWDGGRLPTEAEWEYAAAGGAANQLYPWGAAAPDATLANYSGNAGRASTLLVGSFSAGRGAFGHYDLAGGMEEWQLDFGSTTWYASASSNPCNNCANLTAASTRVTRGGSWETADTLLRAVARSGGAPGSAFDYRGFRCVRDRL